MATGRNYISEWKSLFVKEEKINTNSLIPGNFYKISVYKYADGQTKSLSGPNISYIFLLGKFAKDKKIYLPSIKLKTVNPKDFFEYMKGMLKFNPLTSQKITEVYENMDDARNNEFSLLLKKIQTDGKNLFSIFKSKTSAMEGYREYIAKSVQSVSYLDINPNYLKLKLTKKSKTPENLKKEQKMLNVRDSKIAEKIVKPKNK